MSNTRKPVTPKAKKLTKRPGRSGRRRATSNTVKVPFVYLLQQAVAANSPASLLFNPSVVPTLTQISAVYQNFRYLRLHIYILPIATNVATAEDYSHSIGFSSDVSAGIAGITSQTQVTQCMPSGTQVTTGAAATAPGVTLPSAHIKLGRSHLLSNVSLKWFKCTGDADTNAWENFQFQLIFYNSSGSQTTYQLLLSGLCEFASPIPSQLTLSTLKFVQTDLYRDALVKANQCHQLNTLLDTLNSTGGDLVIESDSTDYVVGEDGNPVVTETMKLIPPADDDFNCAGVSVCVCQLCNKERIRKAAILSNKSKSGDERRRRLGSKPVNSMAYKTDKQHDREVQENELRGL
jgi:hypothetical protein